MGLYKSFKDFYEVYGSKQQYGSEVSCIQSFSSEAAENAHSEIEVDEVAVTDVVTDEVAESVELAAVANAVEFVEPVAVADAVESVEPVTVADADPGAVTEGAASTVDDTVHEAVPSVDDEDDEAVAAIDNDGVDIPEMLDMLRPSSPPEAAYSPPDLFHLLNRSPPSSAPSILPATFIGGENPLEEILEQNQRLLKRRAENLTSEQNKRRKRVSSVILIFLSALIVYLRVILDHFQLRVC